MSGHDVPASGTPLAPSPSNPCEQCHDQHHFSPAAPQPPRGVRERSTLYADAPRSMRSSTRTPCSMIPMAAPSAAATRFDRIAGVIKATHPDFRYQPLSEPEVVGDGRPRPLGLGRPRQAAGLCRHRCRHRPRRQDRRGLPLLRRVALKLPAPSRFQPCSLAITPSISAGVNPYFATRARWSGVPR
jgi:hypothetical protein